MLGKGMSPLSPIWSDLVWKCWMARELNLQSRRPGFTSYVYCVMGQLGSAVDRAPVQESGGLSSNLTSDTWHSLAVWPWASHLTPVASSWVISSHPDEYMVTGFRWLWRRSEAGDLHSPSSLKTKSSASHVIISLMSWSSSATKDEHTHTLNFKNTLKGQRNIGFALAEKSE